MRLFIIRQLSRNTYLIELKIRQQNRQPCAACYFRNYKSVIPYTRRRICIIIETYHESEHLCIVNIKQFCIPVFIANLMLFRNFSACR